LDVRTTSRQLCFTFDVWITSMQRRSNILWWLGLMLVKRCQYKRIGGHSFVERTIE